MSKTCRTLFLPATFLFSVISFACSSSHIYSPHAQTKAKEDAHLAPWVGKYEGRSEDGMVYMLLTLNSDGSGARYIEAMGGLQGAGALLDDPIKWSVSNDNLFVYPVRKWPVSWGDMTTKRKEYTRRNKSLGVGLLEVTEGSSEGDTIFILYPISHIHAMKGRAKLLSSKFE